jgi:hypothetical protein
MAIGQLRVHGFVAAGGFYGYQPLVIKIADSGSGFTADSPNTTDAGMGAAATIVPGGYSKAVKAIETLGSIVVMSGQTNASICVIVDAATFNAGAGATTAGAYGALKDAIASQGFTVGNLTVTTSTALNGDGTFTFA